jgi:hypothetical protein
LHFKKAMFAAAHSVPKICALAYSSALVAIFCFESGASTACSEWLPSRVVPGRCGGSICSSGLARIYARTAHVLDEQAFLALASSALKSERSSS